MISIVIHSPYLRSEQLLASSRSVIPVNTQEFGRTAENSSNILQFIWAKKPNTSLFIMLFVYFFFHVDIAVYKQRYKE